MKRFSAHLLSFVLTCLILMSGCSKQDPMEMKIKASNMKEYEESILKITRAIKDDDERNKFTEALELVAVGPMAIIQKNLPGSGVEEKQLEELAFRFDGKTPREIIGFAEEWKKDTSRDPREFLEAMLNPEQVRERLDDSEWRAWSGMISNSFNKMDMLKRSWIERDKERSGSIPTVEEIEAEFGERAWPQENFPSGAVYVFNAEGEPSCLIDGYTIPRETPALHDREQYEKTFGGGE